MSDEPQGPGWWQASDGNWYPPQGPQPAPGGPPPPGAGYAYGGPGMAPQATNSKATISLVLGIVGIVACGLLAGIPAIFLGSSAKKEIDGSGGREGGRGLATAGQVLGWISVAFSVLALVAIIALAAFGGSVADDIDDINSDPPDGVCDPDRFWQDPDC